MSVGDLGGDPERGHSYEIGLDLESAEPQAGHESCPICEAPFTTEGERLECEASRRRTPMTTTCPRCREYIRRAKEHTRKAKEYILMEANTRLAEEYTYLAKECEHEV